MNSVIRNAISGRASLAFFYKGSQRRVEPHTYGANRSGRDVLCGWQDAGGSGEGFRLFYIEEMSGLMVGAAFDSARPGFQRGDSQFQVIYAEL